MTQNKRKMNGYSDKLPLLEKIKHGYNPMTEGIRWTEKYAETLDRIWVKLPKWLAQVIATMAVFVLASSIQGWLELFFFLGIDSE